jgi:hypothetical protein
MKRLLPALPLLLAAGAALAQERPIQLTIAPGKVGEVCMPLEAGDTLAWRFKAEPAADFNLHQHVGEQVLMPVQRKAAAEDRADHTVDRRNDWCLMWTAPAGQRVTVAGVWSVRKAGAK